MSTLSEEESKLANEAKQRTMNILTDALKKKERLLVERPEELGDLPFLRDVPLISPDLVQGLINELKIVTFMKELMIVTRLVDFDLSVGCDWRCKTEFKSVKKIKQHQLEKLEQVLSFLSEDESKLANEAKERTLTILTDALRKKESLLVERPEELGDPSLLRDVPWISSDLVQGLINELNKVTFMKDDNPQPNPLFAYVYPGSSHRVIYLCPLFWKQQEYLGSNSRIITLIHEVSHFLGYEHHVLTTNGADEAQKHRIQPLTIYDIEKSFEIWMSHRGTYTEGSYSCCGEKSRDTLCEESYLSSILR
ncbi:uncharacterized protein O3C94_019821 [Discoglossus pictus]